MNAHAANLPADAATDAPLVLLPGSLCDERLFAPLLERLPGRASMVAPLSGATLEEAARAVLAEAPPRFALLGFSLGGIVALDVALRAPDRVVGLALVGSNARERAAGADAASVSPVQAVAAAWPRYVATGRRDDPAIREIIDTMARRTTPARHRAQQALVRERPDRRDRLAELVMPTLVLAGSDDALCPPAMQHEMAERLPDAVLALIEGAGHFMPLETPDQAAAHVAMWLGRVDAALATPIFTPDTLQLPFRRTHDQE